MCTKKMAQGYTCPNEVAALSSNYLQLKNHPLEPPRASWCPYPFSIEAWGRSTQKNIFHWSIHYSCYGNFLNQNMDTDTTRKLDTDTKIHSLKLTFSHLKMDGWKTRGPAYFQGRTVSFRECIVKCIWTFIDGPTSDTLRTNQPKNIWASTWKTAVGVKKA